MATQSAAERRAEAHQRYNEDLSGCPGHAVLAILAEKWVTLVLAALAEGPLRRSEIAAAVAGASQKMLTQTLRRLERDGLVSRCVTATVPVRVDYSLTNLGRELLPVQKVIRDWGMTNLDRIRIARAEFDHAASKAKSE
ncbi:MAG: winged helix-turn-helix transcriptional regulator [Jatrophihabitans sp.]